MNFVERLKVLRQRREPETTKITGEAIAEKLAAVEEDFERIARDVAAVSMNRTGQPGPAKPLR